MTARSREGSRGMPFHFKEKAHRRAYFSRRMTREVVNRERYYSLFVVLVVKIVLFFFLWGLFASAVRVMGTSFKNINGAWRVALPAAIVVMAVFIARTIYKNIKEIIALRRELREQEQLRRQG